MDNQQINDIIDQYITNFDNQWGKEQYKWKVVQCFQENWDIDAPDFADMLDLSLSKTGNLLAAMNSFPRAMIVNFAKAAPEDTRKMFRILFDESLHLEDRTENFITEAQILQKTYSDGTWKQNYQNTNAISTYLWLRFPDKYYIYKYSEYNTVSRKLAYKEHFSRNGSPTEMIKGFAFYNEITSVLQQNEKIVKMFQEILEKDKSLYCDSHLHTATIDFCFWVSRCFDENRRPNFKFSMIGAEIGETVVYTPTNTEVQIASDDEIEYKGDRYKLSAFAKKFAPQELHRMSGAYRGPSFFTYKGRTLTELRDEIEGYCHKEKDTDVDIELDFANDNTRRYWWLVANPRIWSMAELPVGESVEYSLYNENGRQRRVFQNLLDAKVGDLVIGYESTPRRQIVALAEVSKSNNGSTIEFTKTEALHSPIDYSAIKETENLKHMQFLENAQGSFFTLTEDEYDCIYDMIRASNAVPKVEVAPAYTQEDFLNEVFMTATEYNKLVKLLKTKKNIILQGAPGVGKTFTAKKLAYSIMGAKEDARIEMVQFHQNYTYEDFIMGYKPNEEGGFSLKKGKFYNFCNAAKAYPDKDFFFIIDEINRGNLSKIFGELLMLIENSYRGSEHKMNLAYSEETFYVPENLYIIGMMNTADRSLAMIDYALRRRFSFYEMTPGFETEGFKSYQKGLQSDIFNQFIEGIKRLNETITRDDSLGTGFCIGHSYFCNQTVFEKEWLNNVLEFDIAPMLCEYWFDDTQKYESQVAMLRNILK